MFSQVNETKMQKLNTWKTIIAAEEASVGASAGSNGYGAIITLADKDAKYLIMATNASDSSPAQVKIRAGNGINATTYEPAQTLGPGSTALIQIESGCYKYVKDEGPMKVESASDSIVGKVFLTTNSSAVKVKLIHMVM